MTTASSWAISRPQLGLIARSRPGWAIAFWRTLILGLLFSLVFLPEFARDGGDNATFSVYAKVIGGFRFVDLALLVGALGHAVALRCLRGRSLRYPRPLVWPGVTFLACISAAIVYGNLHGGSNFFFDWRGLALGIALYLIWSFWLQDAFDVTAVVRLFAIYIAVRIAILYGDYLAGSRDTLLGISIPVFDGPVLSCIVFAGLLALGYRESAFRATERLRWSVLALSAYLIVLLSFRRTYWGELALGSLLLVALRKQARMRTLVLLVIAVALAAAILGASFTNRLHSLDVTSNESEFSADNADHIYDLLDAWEQVREAPLTGIGLGTSYPTWHIRRWKPESVMVHNAVLHVWLKYGLTGLLCYLWFHIALLAWLYRRSRNPVFVRQPFFSVAFAYLTAQFLMTLGFAPWPYSELQLTTLMSFILAAAVAAERFQIWQPAAYIPLQSRSTPRSGGYWTR